MIRSLFAFALLFAFASTSDAGWLRDRIEARRGGNCKSGCVQASGGCSTGCTSATDNGCLGCTAAAAPNGNSFTTAATPQLVQVCVNGKCQLVPAGGYSLLPKAADPIQQVSVPAPAPDTIVIDGKAYRLTPIGSP